MTGCVNVGVNRVRILCQWKGSNSRPDIEGRQGGRRQPRHPASSLDGWWTRQPPPLAMGQGCNSKYEVKTHQAQHVTFSQCEPTLTKALDGVSKCIQCSKLHFVFIARNREEGFPRKLFGINLINIHIYS